MKLYLKSLKPTDTVIMQILNKSQKKYVHPKAFIAIVHACVNALQLSSQSNLECTYMYILAGTVDIDSEYPVATHLCQRNSCTESAGGEDHP